VKVAHFAISGKVREKWGNAAAGGQLGQSRRR